MQNKKLTLVMIISLLFISYNGMAQNNTSSPYSRFGIGDLASQGFGRSKAMGGTGIALRSNRTLNNINPASYTALDSMSFILEFGMKAKFSKFNTDAEDQTQENSDVNFDYLAFAFPVTRWWRASFGLMTVSNVGYKIQQFEEDDDIGNIFYEYSGTGGLNRTYLSNGFKISKNLSLGVGVNYVFGALDINREVQVGDSTGIQSIIRSLERSQVKDVMFEFGLQYYKKLNSNYDLTIGTIFRDRSELSTDYKNITTNTRASIDTLVSTNEKTMIDLPKTYGIGFVVTKDDKLSLSIDYKHQNWSNARFLGKKDTLTNSNRIAMGMEYTPNAGAVRGYFKKINYRLGGHYENSYLKIRGEQLKNYGISFGVGLPLRKSLNYLNVTMELGQRGTLNDNLIKENYGKISINFSLFEYWFVKRKFD